MWRSLLRAASQAARTSGSAFAQAETQALQQSSQAPATLAAALRCTGSHYFATNSTDVFNVHHETPDNTKDIKFDFTAENYKIVNDIIANYPANYKASAVIPVLDIAQQQHGGWIPLAAMDKIAEILGMAPIRVYEVATFYSMFNRSKVGKYYIQVCGTTPCRLNGAQKVTEALTEYLGIGMGQTTEDGTFTLGEMECMGACVNAPMIVVSDYSNGVEGFSYIYYEDLTPEDAVNVAKAYAAGKPPPRRGSQHRNTCEPAGHSYPGKGWTALEGHRVLTEPPPGPFCRDLDAKPETPPVK